MVLVTVAALCIFAAAVSGAIFGLLRGRQTIGAVVRSVQALDLTNPSAMLEVGAFSSVWAPLANQINRLIAGRRLADLAAREAVLRARAVEGRAEQMAADLAPVIADLRSEVELLRDAALVPDDDGRLGGVARELRRLESLLGGMVDQATGSPDARADLCAAVRSATRAIGRLHGVVLTLDLDERDCGVRAEAGDLARMATALLRYAVEASTGAGGRKKVGVYVRRIPRVRLEEPQVRRRRDPGLTINPRRPNPRLERWLREGRPPAEVVKFIVADGGDGIPAEVERRLHDASVGGAIGLTMARRLIERAGGTVWVQRAREGGAALHIVLPVVAEAGPAVRPREGRGRLVAGTA